VPRPCHAAAAAFLVALFAPLPPAAGAPEEGHCSAGAGAGDRSFRGQIGDAGLEALAPDRRARLLELLNSTSCLCGCRHTLASCRADEPGCARSRTLVSELMQRTAAGASDSDLQAYLRSQPIQPRPRPASPPAGAPRVAPPQAASAPVLDAEWFDIPTTGAPARGPEEAPVTIIEFADFQCPFCARSQPLLDAVLRAYGAGVRLVFKHFPIESHAYARGAALVAMAAHEQGKFWEMHDRLFAAGGRMDRQAAVGAARELGIDEGRFERDLDSPELAERLERDRQDGVAARLTGTPAFYVNGRRLRQTSGAAFRQAIGEALAGPRGASPPEGGR
jgi:protein-disulfide isomerase